MITRVHKQLVEAVRLHLRADVPIGIYLSGGIDSSIVAGIVSALVQEDDTHLGNNARRITCFGIEMPEESGFNEFSMLHEP